MTRRVFVSDDVAGDAYIGQPVGDVSWYRIIPGRAWQIVSRGFADGPIEGEGPSRGMWLLLEAKDKEAA